MDYLFIVKHKRLVCIINYKFYFGCDPTGS